MKKIIISAIAAASLLFGFASCSGDLHDDEKRPIDLSCGYYLVGSMTGNWKNTDADVIAFEKTETAGSYKVPFRADSTKVNFAFVPTPGSWNGQIGGDKMVGGDMPANAKFSDTDNGNGGRNGTIDGLETGSDYKLIVTALDDGTLKIDCSSNVPPTPFYLNGYFISGSMNSGAADDKSVLSDTKMSVSVATGYVTYYYDFDFKAAENADWGQSDTATAIAFNIRNTGYTVKYEEATYSLGTDSDYVESKKAGSKDNIVTGLTDGKSYRIYVQTTPEKTVSFKVVQLNEVKLTLNVSDLPDALNGVDFYLRGTMNEWVGKDTYKATVTSNALSVSWNYTYEGTSFEKDYECKFGLKEAWDPQLSAAGAQNLTIKFKDAAATLNYKYNGTSEKDGEENTYYVIVENK